MRISCFVERDIYGHRYLWQVRVCRHPWSKGRPGLQPESRERTGDVLFQRTCAGHTSLDPAPRGLGLVTALGR